MDSMDIPDSAPKPRTSTVLVFLAAFAIVASWLGVYAVTNALVAADLLPGWPRETDPRPRWMLNAFLGLFGLFGVLALSFAWVSRRQLRNIDAMADGE